MKRFEGDNSITPLARHDAAAGCAGLLRAFLKNPAPMSLVDAQGATLLDNEAMRARFGCAGIDPASARAAIASGAEEVVLRLQGGVPGGPSEVVAHAYRMPDRMLVIVKEPGGARPSDGELERLRERVGQLEHLAATDHLTGAWNRAHFDRLIAAELVRSMGIRLPLSLVLIDIDHFKRVNDTFGHAAGDSVLRELVRLVQSRVRASDFLFRWGGEEFAILASTRGYRGAERLAEGLRAAVEAHDFGPVGAITASAGVAEHAGDEGPPAWFARLDKALYAAKEQGRNRVVTDRQGNSDEWAGDPGHSALHLEWQEGYECGEPTIDEEHRELFRLSNRLIDRLASADTSPGQAGEALDALIAHVVRHFADEEALLEKAGYADLDKHRAAHAGLARRALYLREQAQKGELALGAVVEFLAQEVVARHLLAVDRAFFPLFARP